MKAPYLPYEALRPLANRFLNEYHTPLLPENRLPIPIEEIVDLNFQMDVVPTPGLHKEFDIDSFITSDFMAIHIDQGVYEGREKRFRFSLAHELAHHQLHQDVFAQLHFNTISEWKASVTSIPEKEYGFLEFQANSWAGLVLVPSDSLDEQFTAAQLAVREAGLNPNSGAALQQIEAVLSDRFMVSMSVIHRRLEFDSLITRAIPYDQ